MQLLVGNVTSVSLHNAIQMYYWCIYYIHYYYFISSQSMFFMLIGSSESRKFIMSQRNVIKSKVPFGLFVRKENLFFSWIKESKCHPQDQVGPPWTTPP